jgi:hypothetical protein
MMQHGGIYGNGILELCIKDMNCSIFINSVCRAPQFTLPDVYIVKVDQGVGIIG